MDGSAIVGDMHSSLKLALGFSWTSIIGIERLTLVLPVPSSGVGQYYHWYKNHAIWFPLQPGLISWVVSNNGAQFEGINQKRQRESPMSILWCREPKRGWPTVKLRKASEYRLQSASPFEATRKGGLNCSYRVPNYLHPPALFVRIQFNNYVIAHLI